MREAIQSRMARPYGQEQMTKVRFSQSASRIVAHAWSTAIFRTVPVYIS